VRLVEFDNRRFAGSADVAATRMARKMLSVRIEMDGDRVMFAIAQRFAGTCDDSSMFFNVHG